jgi:GntR family transcriptional regulator
MQSLRIDPADPRPIWRQIEEGVRHLVATGGLAAASPLPSVRDLARDLQVNPATVSKAYQRLTEAGVLAVRRGDGTYVAELPPPLPTAERRQRLRTAALRYAAFAATLGATAEEVTGELIAAWQAITRARQGGKRGTPTPPTDDDSEGPEPAARRAEGRR